jgi:hypothetical protein
VAINVRGNAPTAAPQVAAIPFTRAARKKTAAAGILTGTVPSSATQLQPVQIPAAGYLAGIELLIDVVTTGNSQTTAFKTAASAGDAPFSFINSINLVNSAGDNLMSNVSGYHLFLLNKYGNFRAQAPFCDPRADQYFALTTGSGGTGGSFRFRLFIPIQADPSSAFCALPNLAANKSYLLNVQLAASSAVYSTAPTTAGTYTINIISHYWSQPAAQNAVGVPQQIAPDGVGSVMLTQLQTISVGGAGDKILQLQNVGNVIKSIIFVLRDTSGIRTVANSWGATNQIILNNDTLFYWTQGTNSSSSWSSHMSEVWGYGEAINATAPGTTSTLDAAGGLDTNVFAVGYFNDLQGGYVRPDTNRNQFLPTLDATLLQLRSTSFGSNAQTLEVITQSIKPTTASALYAPHY